MTERVSKSFNFTELFDALKEIGNFQENQKVYTPSRIWDLAYAARALVQQRQVGWKDSKGQRKVSAPSYMTSDLISTEGSNLNLEGAESISIDEFESMRKSGDPLACLPESYGIRDKVRELIKE